MAGPPLQADGIEKRLGDSTVLEDIDLGVERGDITVVIGPNGAGKTVLLCCLAGALVPDEGSVTIEGQRMGTAARKALSFLPQGSLAIDSLTGRENLRFYTRLHPAGPDRWRRLIAALELEGDIDARVGTYSSGMVRKLELAIALDPDVPVYLFDEPTAGVDLAKVTRFHDLILSETEAGKTVVLSSHTPIDMELADSMVVVQDGRIVETGSPATLLETLPEVLRVRGRVGRLADTRTDLVLGDQWYVRGDEIRGFLRSDSDPEQSVRTLSSQDGILGVTVEAPSFVDLFNYYTDPVVTRAAGMDGEGEAEWR